MDLLNRITDPNTNETNSKIMATVTKIDLAEAEKIVKANWREVVSQLERHQGSWAQQVASIQEPCITRLDKGYGLPVEIYFSCKITTSRLNRCPPNIPAGKERVINATTFVKVLLETIRKSDPRYERTYTPEVNA